MTREERWLEMVKKIRSGQRGEVARGVQIQERWSKMVQNGQKAERQSEGGGEDRHVRDSWTWDSWLG